MAYKDTEGKMGAFYSEGATLQCDMSDGCTSEPTMLEEKGFIYCGNHGITRHMYGHRVRKLRAHEINRLKRGDQLKGY